MTPLFVALFVLVVILVIVGWLRAEALDSLDLDD